MFALVVLLSALTGLSLVGGYGSEGGKINQGGNKHEFCCWWAMIGECNSNPFWMRPNCQFSCGTRGCDVEDAESCPVSVNLEGCPWKKKLPTTKGPKPDCNDVPLLTADDACWPVKDDAGCIIKWKCLGSIHCSDFHPPKPAPPADDSECVDYELHYGDDMCKDWFCIKAERPKLQGLQDCMKSPLRPQTDCCDLQPVTFGNACPMEWSCGHPDNCLVSPPSPKCVFKLIGDMMLCVLDSPEHAPCPTTCPRPTEKSCKNANKYCNFWAFSGECRKNPKQMKKSCGKACNTC